MAIETIVTQLSAYHNYKYNGVLRKEILIGGEGNGFFLHAREVAHPDEFPRLSLNLFSADGALVAVVRGNRVDRLAVGFVEERGADGLAIRNPRGAVLFSYCVKRYQNVYVTEITGELYDDKGNLVNP